MWWGPVRCLFSVTDVPSRDALFHRLPAQPDGVPWPTSDWPTGPVPAGVELDPLIDEAFDPGSRLQETYAVVIVHRGKLVFERYGGALPRFDKPGKPVEPETPLLSWSMAKSILHAVVGILVGGGLLTLDDPVPVRVWRAPGDPRGAITLEHLLVMRDGLAFDESYDDPEVFDVLQMLFGPGAADVAAFAADRPLAAQPGERFNYSSGTSNVISGIVARTLGPGEAYRRFLVDTLFGPLGMGTATATFDEAGTWVASSYVHAAARDYARFGLFILRDGIWEGKRLVPVGWVDHGRRPRSIDPDDGNSYGAHWWTRDDPYGTFWAAGHDGQYIDICPGLDLVLVRLGRTTRDHTEDLRDWRNRVIDAFGVVGREVASPE